MKYSILIAIICIQLLVPFPAIGIGASGKAPVRATPRVQRFEFTPQMLPGLAGKVEVIQDEFGIPHVFAKKTEDVYFMEGFLHARDRFFQMDVTRRTAEGTVAELLG